MPSFRHVFAHFTLLLLSTSAFAQKRTINIAAAADLQPLLPAVLAEFQASSGVIARAAYGSSATLATQIINGAPFDLFLSADMTFPQRVIDAGAAKSAKPVPYARGTLVLWERKDGSLQPLAVSSLAASTLKTVAIANPETAPYGRAAKASLASLHLSENVQSKLRIAENIAQAAQFAESGNAQLGLISLTAAKTERLQKEGNFVPMPESSYPPILQGAVVIRRGGANSMDAERFLNFLLSLPVQGELARRGLKAPN